MNNKEKDRKAWAEIVARAWTDEKFKKRLFSHPEEVFKEYGITAKSGVRYKIIEEKPSEVTIVFPHLPEETLSQNDLKKIAGGEDGTGGSKGGGGLGFGAGLI